MIGALQTRLNVVSWPAHIGRFLVAIALTCMAVFSSGTASAVTVTASPGNCEAIAGSGQPWSFAKRAEQADENSSNNLYATATIDVQETSNFLHCSDYGFNIPANATIDGITVTVERHSSAGGWLDRVTSHDATVQLLKNGVRMGSNRATTTIYPTADIREAHGGVNDLWGSVWTPADIGNSGFGAAFAAINNGWFFVDGANTISVDHIEVTITYTVNTPPVLSSVSGFCGSVNQVLVGFSQTLDTASAQTAGNYVLSGGVLVTSAALQPDGKTVLLKTSSMGAGSYTLTVNGVKNQTANPIAANSQMSFTVNGTLASGVRGLYYNGISDQFPGTPVQRIDSTINFDWGTGAPMVGIPANLFSVRWTGYLRPSSSGNYVLRTRSDDGVRLYLDGQNLINNWTDHSATNNDSPTVALNAGQYYPLQMDFYENGGDAVAQLLGSYAGGSFATVPAGNLFYCAEPIVGAAGSFNAFESATPAGVVDGVIKTKVAATTFALDLVALDASKTAIQSSFTGDVKVELLGSTAIGVTSGADNCPQNFTSLGSAVSSFAAGDAGRKSNVAFAPASFSGMANAWRDVRVRISYPATGTASVVACSTDNFAIRPASLANVTVRDGDWASAGDARTLSNVAVAGGVVHKAGRPFTISAEGRNSAGIVTTNYVGNPEVLASTCGAAGSGCTPTAGIVSPGTWNPAGGAVKTSTASYSEVGSFALQLQDTNFSEVDLSDGSTVSERNIPASARVNVGRFVPDRFVVAVNNTPVFKTFNDTTCSARSFTYIGQPFGYVTAPMVHVTALNAAGVVTKNYQNAWWKIGAADVSRTYSPTADLETVTIGAAAITNINAGTGLIALDPSDTLRYVRNATTPQAPFSANITLAVSVQDASETSGTINSATSALFDGGGTGIAFDSGNAFRYGRLRLSNTHGSELLNLPVPIRLEYWPGSASSWVLNQADTCTKIQSSDFSFVYPGATTNNLAACETAMTISSSPLNAILTKPGAGNNGWVDLTLNLGGAASGSRCAVVGAAGSAATTANQPWLQFGWGGAGLANPSARATFGAYKGSSNVIYFRENY